jgi:hypothetical protein
VAERTFSIIKPDAVKAGKAGAILSRLEQAGFRIVALRLRSLTRAEAEGFYHVHQARPFFSSLCAFMSSGPCIAMVLERDGSGQGGGGDDPQGLRVVDRGERDPRLRRARDGGVRDRLLLSGHRARLAGAPASEPHLKSPQSRYERALSKRRE